MSWFTKLFNGSSLVESIGVAADRFIRTDDEKAQFQVAMADLIAQREREVESSLRTELAAKQGILEAELQQGDTYTKRARPTVVYFGLVVIFLNYVLIPLVLYALGDSPDPFALPVEFWTAWGGITGTWAIGRSFEKVKAGTSLTRMITGSKKLPNLLDL